MNNLSKRKRTIVDIVSGKGGTGKTLLSAVLADALANQGVSVLAIDLDVFVRGLTVLLYLYRKERIQLIDSDALSVYSYIAKSTSPGRARRPSELGICRFRSFDLLPSVSRVDQVVDYHKAVLDDRSVALRVLRNLLTEVAPRYEVVLLDSRAGVDEFISATHAVSDITICVREDDPVSRFTDENLVTQLEAESDNPIFRLTNKARRILSIRDLERLPKDSVTDLGVIPFDMDIMNAFGTDNFWEVTSRSLYRAALIRAWNTLNDKMVLGYPISEHRISPIASESFERRVGNFSFKERIYLVYGTLLSLLGIGYALAGREMIAMFFVEPARLVALVAGVAGMGLVLLTITNFLSRR
jgi:septum site-determining protein MinD